MGDELSCATTPKAGVAQGGANLVKDRCATTTPPKGGVGGGGAVTGLGPEVAHNG